MRKADKLFIDNIEMLMNIRAVSADTVKDGNYVLPWIAFDGITIK